uniref:Uncharacterized protein n=1 Tax=Anopheles dirus TaxID=7168 RepID=A0A182NX53_9DIPT
MISPASSRARAHACTHTVGQPVNRTPAKLVVCVTLHCFFLWLH